jgi:putative hydrolase of the HAD superfamily
MRPPKPGGPAPPRGAARAGALIWLFDLDDTLHDATHASMREIREAMGRYMERELAMSAAEAQRWRSHYWQRYGATLLGLVRHHGVDAAHFLRDTHVLPGLEDRVRGHARDIAALARLRGARYIVTNAPAAYAARVLGVLGIAHLFDGIVAVEDMHMFGDLRPKPDARMLRALAARLRTTPARCVLVEDTLVHLRSARRVGMRTVWMRGWSRDPGASRRRHGRPAYVDRRVTRLAALR